jgi:hypothetical protein
MTAGCSEVFTGIRLALAPDLGDGVSAPTGVTTMPFLWVPVMVGRRHA